MKPRGLLEAFYVGAWQEPRTSASELSLLAIDLETTGLDAASDQVPSVGFVPVDGPDIVQTEALAALMARGPPGLLRHHPGAVPVAGV